jgi:hypothetical protein
MIIRSKAGNNTFRLAAASYDRDCYFAVFFSEVCSSLLPSRSLLQSPPL